MPSKITFGDGSTIVYLYGADGTKLRTTHTINGTVTTTDYCDNVIYENGTATRLLTEAGYVSLNDNKYHYYLQDHQGNNRVVVNQSGTVEETNHYYPFGGVFANTNNVQPYKYNGKEFDSKKGLNWYDYGARHYDAALGRFMTVDPLAEKYYGISPYVYVANNPIKFVDPTGMWIGDYYDRQGNYLGNDGIDDGKIYLMNEGVRAKSENTTVNWGGTLSEAHSNDLKANSTEVGGLIVQDRIEEGSDYTISEFETVGGTKQVDGYMLEPAGPSTTQSGQDKRIPEGVYDLDNYSSAKYPDNFILSNSQVSKERKILYHIGNFGKNTEGCNMPGGTKGNGSVGNSTGKFKELRTFIKSIGANNVKTIINNKIPK